LQLTIYISDENDNAPVFTQDIYTATIPENVPQGYSVIRVNTSDADTGINAEHSFTITGIAVVVQFYPWFNFNFPLFFFMLIYDNEHETKENKNWVLGISYL